MFRFFKSIVLRTLRPLVLLATFGTATTFSSLTFADRTVAQLAASNPESRHSAAVNNDGQKSLVSSFSEDFSSMTITENSTTVGANDCSGGVPSSTFTFTPSPSTHSNKWSFFSSGSTYPITWSGTTATQAWAIASNQMGFHGAKGSNDDGHAILSRDTFDRSKYIIASTDIRAYCSNSSSGCFAGIALINEESNYRGLYLRTDASNTVSVVRLAPCNLQSTGQSFGANTWQTLTVEYRGPEGGKWSYYINGQRVNDTTGEANFVVSGIESSDTGNTDVALTSDPRIGLYTTSSVTDGYVEGAIANVSAITLTKVTPFGASASSNSAAAGGAIDENPSSAWIASSDGSQWIEIDLGASVTIRKVRLLTEQTPSGNTVHEVYVGASPAPTTLVKTFAGTTATEQWLDETFVNSPPTGRYLRILSPTSPSWRAWREIEIYN